MAEYYSGIVSTLGLFGVAFYLGAYAALQLGLVRGTGYMYTLLNMIGAILVLISLTQDYNLASAIIQISWIILSVIGLTRLYLRNRRLVFTEDELSLMRERLPNLPKPSAKAFFKSGGWVDLPDGEELLREGSNVEHLFYLASGSVAVKSGAQEIAQMQSGFLGEINVLEGAPASATVTTTSPSKAFVIAREELKKLMAQDPEFRSAIEIGLSRELGKKLVSANRQLIGAQADIL